MSTRFVDNEGAAPEKPSAAPSVIRLPSSVFRHAALVEAEGFEPSSCIRSSTTSTRVSARLVFPNAGRAAAVVRMIPSESHSAVVGTLTSQPGFSIPKCRPGQGYLSGTAGVKPKLYAARAKLLFAVVNFPSVLRGTRVPRRAVIEPPTQSKPVAPLLLWEYTRRRRVLCPWGAQGAKITRLRPACLAEYSAWSARSKRAPAAPERS